MKILFYLGHPAHFHLFKNVIINLSGKGNDVSVLIKKKDILEELLILSNIPYINILPEGRNDSKAGIAAGMIKRDFRLLRFCINKRQDLMVGTSTEIGHVGTLLKIPSLNINEDDADVVPLYSRISYPWSTYIVSPSCCNNGKWENKSIKYEGYHELAYLHPDNFTPSREIVRKYFSHDRPYFLIRFAKLTAHHDKGITGITDDLALKILDILRPFGEIYITSERVLDQNLEPYRLSINPLDIHHVMAFASLYIGDSQTMAAEAGVLGVPFIRYNDFVGRIGYLNELENKYRLGFGIKPDDTEELLRTISTLVNSPDLNDEWRKRRQKMLEDKINFADFLTRLIIKYPEILKAEKIPIIS
jgi:predicted glycosyltransferase